MTQLLVSDPLCFRIWAGKVGAIDQHFGKNTSLDHSADRRLAGRDAQSAYLSLPEQLAKVARNGAVLALAKRGEQKRSLHSLLLGQLPTLITNLKSPQSWWIHQ